MKLTILAAAAALFLSGCFVRTGRHNQGASKRDNNYHCHDRGGKHHKQVCHSHPHDGSHR